MKRQLPIFITFIAGITMIIQFFLPRLEHATVPPLGDLFLNWFLIIFAFAYILGGASLVVVNFSKIAKSAPGWGYNAVLLVGLFGTLAAGLFGGINEGSLFRYIFNYVFTPLSATMFALLAFFIASAAFRAFKAKTMEATLLLIAALIVMIGQVPLGQALWSHLPFLKGISLNILIDDWIMNGFNAAGQRAIILGASLGLISMSLKILLGIERSYLGGD